MLRQTLLTLCMATSLAGCEVLMLGNFCGRCALRPIPELLPSELPAAAVGVPYSIRLDVINASTPVSTLQVAPSTPLPDGLQLTHTERDKHGEIRGTPTEAGRYNVLVYGSTYYTQCAGQDVEKLYTPQVTE